MSFCKHCPVPDICKPPLHNLLVCCGPECVPACPRFAWHKRHNQHRPHNDDGVTYCGWTTEAGTWEGCGHAWPCPTVAREHGGDDHA